MPPQINAARPPAASGTGARGRGRPPLSAAGGSNFRGTGSFKPPRPKQPSRPSVPERSRTRMDMDMDMDDDDDDDDDDDAVEEETVTATSRQAGGTATTKQRSVAGGRHRDSHGRGVYGRDDDNNSSSGDDDDNDDDRDANGRHPGDISSGSRTAGATALPPALLARLLHHFFRASGRSGGGTNHNDTTRITQDANTAVNKYMEIFVREAVARSVAERSAGGFLDVDVLQKIAGQLIMDL